MKNISRSAAAERGAVKFKGLLGNIKDFAAIYVLKDHVASSRSDYAEGTSQPP